MAYKQPPNPNYQNSDVFTADGRWKPQLSGNGGLYSVNTPYGEMMRDGQGRLHYLGAGGNAMPVDANWTLKHRTPEGDLYHLQFEANQMMALQAQQQAEYMRQMQELQESQMLQQQQAAALANIESEKKPEDFTVSGADDTARKQLLRRGLMSTFTRYGSGQGGAMAGKASKLGG